MFDDLLAAAANMDDAEKEYERAYKNRSRMYRVRYVTSNDIHKTKKKAKKAVDKLSKLPHDSKKKRERIETKIVEYKQEIRRLNKKYKKYSKRYQKALSVENAQLANYYDCRKKYDRTSARLYAAM